MESYRDNHIIYSDLGFNTAPVTLRYPFATAIKKIKLRNNFNPVLGLGYSYKWFNLRLGITLPASVRSEDQFGKTTYFDLGFDFSLKRLFFDIDLHIYSGYAFKNATKWNDTLTKEQPNSIREDIGTASFSVNTWQFWSDDFKINAFRGKSAAYVKDAQTFYLKYTVNLHGINSNFGLVPTELRDSSVTKTLSNSFTAFDFGVVPGYAYVNRYKQFQIGAMVGLGLVIQSKFYVTNEITRGFLGLAPRYDIKLIAGINKPKSFLMLVTDFDNKSIRFNDLVYRQSYYSIKIIGGLRFVSKKDPKAKRKKKIN